MLHLPSFKQIMNNLKHFIYVLLFVLAISVVNNAFAGGPPPGPPPGGGGGPPCWPPPCVPIDGGLGFLLIAGTLYGGKKIYDINKKD